MASSRFSASVVSAVLGGVKVSVSLMVSDRHAPSVDGVEQTKFIGSVDDDGICMKYIDTRLDNVEHTRHCDAGGRSQT